MKLYHGTNQSSAINIIKKGIDLKYSKRYLDFGVGFYTTPSYEHAAITAIRTTIKHNARYKLNEEPYIVEVYFKPVKEIELYTKAYPRHSDEWGKFVLCNRLTPDILAEYNIKEHNQDARYDVCYGEIADGSIANIAYEVNNRIIRPNEVDYKRFLKNNGKVYPLQYSFHTTKAISCISVVSCDKIKNIKNYLKQLKRG